MSFAATLLEWFRENGRELPWRGTKDPYAIWLSEIILQQTQVKQGWEYWERFMRHWPTVEALAAATEDEVLREWQGLGYYSRARNLHTAAQQIVARGGFPTTIEGIKQLKGVGDYTAAAIGSIAFGLPAAVVDGNVYRVLSRYYGISTPINTTQGKKEFQALAQSLLPTENGELPTENGELRTERYDYLQGEMCSEQTHKTDSKTNHTSQFSPLSSLQAKRTSSSAQFNQAIMDFGAIQCTPAKPQCLQCPLQDTCTAFREGHVAELPVKQKTLKVKERRLTYIYIRCQGMTAIRRRPAGDIWQGLYEPLLIENEQLKMDNWAAQNNCQLSIINYQLLAKQVKHVLTHRVLYADFYLLETEEKPQLPPEYFWISEADIDNYAVPRLVEILLETL
jgi:A/G-specific adenine glycosylase